MILTTDDRVAITDLIHQHGHLVDHGEFERMTDVFTPDVVLDVTDLGGGVLVGLAAVHQATLALARDAHPVAHHVTNVVLTPADDDCVQARSKGLGVRTDGSVGSVTYEDTISHGPQGWRITRRTIRARHTPLTG